jgi:Ser/Thr protein kinase RdoA (MazF antagonist)
MQEAAGMAFDCIIKSFFAPDVLALRLEAEYGFQNVQCQLITATLRDVYLILSRASRYILIVYRHSQRTYDEIVAEWRFVAYLAQQHVPVAPALPTTNGDYILTFHAPEGVRYAVVTTHVSGQHLRRRPSRAASHNYGQIIATIHQLADAAPPTFIRNGHDLVASLEQATTAIKAVLVDRPADVAYIAACAAELQARLTSLTHDAPAYGIIHGDVVRANALVGDDNTVSVIDFDWYGLGWRAYDIASYLLTIRGDPNEQVFAEGFLSGYTFIRPVAAHEYPLLPLFEAVRAIFEIGTPALNVDHWGRAYLYGFLDQSLARLKRSMQHLP